MIVFSWKFLALMAAGIKRKYDKRYYCLYCEKPQSKLPRHLESVHKDEPEVRRLEAATGNKRTALLTKLRNEGNNKHNAKVIAQGDGDLAIVYRRQVDKPVDDLVICKYCSGWFAMREFWKHKRRCLLNPGNERAYTQHVKEARLLKPVTHDVSAKFKKVISTMQNDEISLIAKHDSLICLYGEKLTLKHGHDCSRYVYITSRLRLLARVLREMRELSSTEQQIVSFDDAMCPSVFPLYLQAARKLAMFNDEDNSFTKASLALKIGTEITHLIDVKLGKALAAMDSESKDKCKELTESFKLRWTSEFTSNAHRSRIENNKNKINILPLSEDVKVLTDYLREESKTVRLSLQRLPDRSNYIKLQRITLAQLITFNRRRVGEVSKLTLTDFQGVQSGTSLLANSNISNALTEVEKLIGGKFDRVEITGKKGRTVAVLMTAEMTSAMRLIISLRNLYQTCDENKYVFSILDSTSHIRGCDVMRQYSTKCGAKCPEAIRSTKLRKHIAIVSQILNLKDHEMDTLANFMGHDIRVHREFYRLPEPTIQIAKMTKFLIAAEQNQLSSFKGMSLDSINVENEELEGKTVF